MRFCPKCGHQVNMEIPDGDNRERAVCPNCSFIDYDNPLMVTGTIPLYQGKVLLCKRNIEPRFGYWTLPAGFMENGETTVEGALRETLEESGSEVTIKQPFSMVSIPHVNQVHLFYIAELKQPDFHPTTESSEVELFELSDIPWDEMAFSSVRKSLEFFVADHKSGDYGFHEDSILISTRPE
ncbi:Bifunctional NMN adenylyltransferase/Nudix hydrolase [Marinomonas aquimarina]|uniref:Bifunctional NMN adenylyltransferase/Nudix hydrolase n=1 Tax=Marinomonas aquimarina TaxID=295068 RepID=A0A1A8TKK2_9GAMM|nr:NUDIX hydrolase [Marinomonas aquimarina]SBS34073.1 Bifunctional NMN adenylyltransferase/Nudix hydrolase [Marinomonas aquimarina]